MRLFGGKKAILRPNNGLILKLMPLLSAIYLGPTPKRRSQAGSLQHFLDDGHTQIHHGKIIEPSAKSLDGGPYTWNDDSFILIVLTSIPASRSDQLSSKNLSMWMLYIAGIINFLKFPMDSVGN